MEQSQNIFIFSAYTDACTSSCKIVVASKRPLILSKIAIRYEMTVNSVLYVYFVFILHFDYHSSKGSESTESSRFFCFKILRFLNTTLTFVNFSLNPLLYCWKIREIREIVFGSDCKSFLLLQMKIVHFSSLLADGKATMAFTISLLSCPSHRKTLLCKQDLALFLIYRESDNQMKP